MPVSRQASVTARASIARIVLALMLALVVLAALAPPGSFASSHECGMACCVGKSPHMAGSCNSGLGDDESEAQAPDDEGDDRSDGHAAHGSKHSSAHHATHATKESRRRTTSVSSRALTKPCSPECAAAAFSSSQVRRPRHAASIVVKAQPRPSTIRSFVGQANQLTPKSADHVRQARPRAPPTSLINLSA
ncbi:MAG TPA: hypothetical protein VJ715_17120 [Pyrinomonadaceae bacterium]|nr:hypothetical protein [Pyrinomonadaceae bacterium]